METQEPPKTTNIVVECDVQDEQDVQYVELVDGVVWEDKLIQEVKKYPIIWDKTKRDYTNLDKCSMVWSIIAKEIGHSDPKKCCERWKSLRDGYVRRLKAVRRVASHGLAPRKPLWRFFEPLQFLDEHVAHRVKTVSKGSDQMLPEYSSSEVVFYDDGRLRAPNKNSLGGMGKSGPASVRVSDLPKQPIALFSRIGLGEIAVFNDTEGNQDGAAEADSDPKLPLANQAPEAGVIVNDSGQIETEIALQNQDFQIDPKSASESSEAVAAITPRTEVIEIVLEEVSKHSADPSVESENPGCAAVNPGYAAVNPGSDDATNKSASCRMSLRPARKRSYRHLAASDDVTEEQEPVTSSSVVADDDDVTSDHVTNSTNQSMRKRKNRKTRTEDENNEFGAFSDGSILAPGDAEFVRYISSAISRLPPRIRVETKLKMQQILHDAELEALNGEAEQSAQQQLQVQQQNQTTEQEEYLTIVLCDGDGSEFQTLQQLIGEPAE